MNILQPTNNMKYIRNERVNAFVCTERSQFSRLDGCLSDAQLSLKRPYEMHQGQDEKT